MRMAHVRSWGEAVVCLNAPAWALELIPGVARRSWSSRGRDRRQKGKAWSDVWPRAVVFGRPPSSGRQMGTPSSSAHQANLRGAWSRSHVHRSPNGPKATMPRCASYARRRGDPVHCVEALPSPAYPPGCPPTHPRPADQSEDCGWAGGLETRTCSAGFKSEKDLGSSCRETASCRPWRASPAPSTPHSTDPRGSRSP